MLRITGPNESAAVSSMGKTYCYSSEFKSQTKRFFGKEYDVLYVDVYADSDAQKSISGRLWIKTLDGASDKFELYAFQLNGFYEIAINDPSTVFNAQNKTVAGTMDCEVDGQEQANCEKNGTFIFKKLDDDNNIKYSIQWTHHEFNDEDFPTSTPDFIKRLYNDRLSQ